MRRAGPTSSGDLNFLEAFRVVSDVPSSASASLVDESVAAAPLPAGGGAALPPLVPLAARLLAAVPLADRLARPSSADTCRTHTRAQEGERKKTNI